MLLESEGDTREAVKLQRVFFFFFFNFLNRIELN